MKLIILSALVALAAADVSHVVAKQDESKAQIQIQEVDVGVDGSYRWRIETDNGISASETGRQKKVNAENAAEVVQGEAQWTAPTGERIALKYIADENGYRPQGDHLPVPPPIPKAIIDALEYIRKHPPKEAV